MKLYRIAFRDAKVFDGRFIGNDGIEYPADSGVWAEAVKMKDGTIYYGANHYMIVLRYALTAPKNVVNIESFGFLCADGTYDVKSNDPIEYLKHEWDRE